MSFVNCRKYSAERKGEKEELYYDKDLIKKGTLKSLYT